MPGRALCIEREPGVTTTDCDAETAFPVAGRAFIYLVRLFESAKNGRHGSDSVVRVRVIQEGNGDRP